MFDAKVERMRAHYVELEEGALHAQVSVKLDMERPFLRVVEEDQT